MRVCEKNRRVTDKAERKKSKKLRRGGETQNRKRKDFFRIKWKRKPKKRGVNINDFALLRHRVDERTRYYIMADRGGGMKNSSSDKSTNSKNNNKKKYYAVASGRKPGVYETWDECKKQVFSFPNAQHKVNILFPPVCLSSLPP